MKKSTSELAIKLRSHPIEEQHMVLSSPIQTLTTIPEELLLHIFSYLSIGELCNTVAKVCKQWERLHWDHHLYNTPMFQELNIPTDEFLVFIEAFPYFAPAFASSYFERVFITQTFQKYHKTFHTKLQRNERVAHNLAKADLIMLFAHLQVVNLTHLPFRPFSKQLSLLLSSCVQLEELTIGSRVFLDNTKLMSCLTQVHGTLRVLDLGCKFDWRLADAITKCHHLEELTFYVTNTFSSSAACLLAIANMSSLRHLTILLNVFTYRWVSEPTWISMFRSLKDLKSLCLHGCYMTNRVAAVIGRNLKNLTKLNIVAAFGTGTVTCKGLRSIMKSCHKLTELEITCSTSWSDAHVEIMMKIPISLPDLKNFLLTCRQLNEGRWMAELKKKMPYLVIWLNGFMMV